MLKIKKINLIVATVVVVVILVTIGGFVYINSTETQHVIEVDENQQNIEIKNGQEFTVNLTSNASTGYSWSVDDTYNKNIVIKISNEYIAPNTKRVGAPGKELWVFKGTGKGDTKLNFVYARQRGNNTSQINSKTLAVTVK